MTIRLTSIRFMITAAGALAAAIVSAGCALPSTQGTNDPALSREDIGESTSAVTTVGSWTDSSGTITVTLYSAGWSTSAAPSIGWGCTIPDDQLLVGGGVRVDEFENTFLQASHPSDDLRTWWGGATNIDGHDRKLLTSCLGLKLQGISGSQLREMAILKKLDSPVAAHPEVTVAGDAGYVTVGGGASTVVGQYLVGSFPAGASWHARSKDHMVSSPGYVRAYLIELPVHPSGFWADLGTEHRWGSSTWVSTGWANAIGGPSPGWAMTSGGGWAMYSGAGRMLFHLGVNNGPFINGTSSVNSSDAFVADSGDLYASTLAIKAM